MTKTNERFIGTRTTSAAAKKKIRMWLSVAVLAIACGNLVAQVNDADARKVAAYPLTADLLQKYIAVTLDMARLSPNDPLRQQLKELSELPLDERVRRFDAAPKAVAMMKARGISTRDLVMTSASVSAAMIVKLATQTGAGQNSANKFEFQASSPDHLKFYDAHKAEIDKFVADIRAAARQ